MSSRWAAFLNRIDPNARTQPSYRLVIRVATLGLLYVALSAITRLIIAAHIESILLPDDLPRLAQAFALGLVRDTGIAVILLTPLFWLLAAWRKPWNSRLVRGVVHALVAAGVCTFVFASVAELFFWDEFDSRFNGIAINYLVFPREVIGNIRESFNVDLYLPIVGLVGLGLWWLVYRAIAKAMSGRVQRPGFTLATAGSLLVFAVSIGVLSGLPRDFSENREVNELAENGLVTMAAAAWTNAQDYDGVYPTIDEAEAIRLTRKMVAQDNTRFLDPDDKRSIRRWVDNGANAKKLNIVMVTEESFGANYVTGLDSESPIPVSPHLARLAQGGLFMTNIYASGDRTVRGLEATETSFEPIPGISTARRPESDGMYSLPGLLRSFGYGSGVLYGGFNGFDNMGAFWAGVGFDHVWDQRDIRHDAFSTIWGVSDEDLFTEALKRLDENAKPGQPFLLTMMTVSNHRPFLFPDHFKADPSFDRRERGAAYADWAFADFIERARSHPWFDDTVFIFVADHGHKMNGAAQVPLDKFRIPVLFYAPKHIAPRRIDALGAQIDLSPTLLGVLGFSYENPFFGIDLTRVPPDGGRIAVAHNFSIAFARGSHAVVLEPNGKAKGFAFRKGNVPLEPGPVDPDTLKQAIAVTQTAHHMFYAHQYHQTGSGAPRS